jgi:hypothetical protein
VTNLLTARAAELDRRIAELHGLRKELRRLVARATRLRPSDCESDRVCHLIGPG